jgi:inosine/guanosine/xanthosine phosphorylase family protein
VTEAQRIIAVERPGFTPKVALILGSGMGAMADDVSDPLAFAYDRLPGFPTLGVEGHAGRLITGKIGATPVAIMQGRAHYYEAGDVAAMKPAIRALRAMGAEILIATNAAGSLDPDMGPGSVMMINDHINLVQASPLVGETGNSRFLDMVGTYAAELQSSARQAARNAEAKLHEGVYVWFAGPQFETPAEIRMARLLGGTAIGMSTVPEAIIARHAGMRVAAFSIITNLGAGMSAESLSHENTMKNAESAAQTLRRILGRLISGLSP